MSSANRSSQRRSGFTLVELLVVIGIISLLISILLPSLNAARRSAQSVKCLSNLRGLGLGFQMYMNDYKGILPPVQYGSGTTNGAFWPNAMAVGKYLVAKSNSSVTTYKPANPLECPSANLIAIANNGDFTAFTNNGSSEIRDVGMMNFKGANVGTDPNDVQSSTYAVSGLGGYWANHPDQLNYTTSWGNRLPTEYYPFCAYPDSTSGFPNPTPARMTAVKNSDTLALAFDGNMSSGTATKYFQLRHGKLSPNANDRFCNFVFLDGHAESIQGGSMPSVQNGDDTIMAQNSAA